MDPWKRSLAYVGMPGSKITDENHHFRPNKKITCRLILTLLNPIHLRISVSCYGESESKCMIVTPVFY